MLSACVLAMTERVFRWENATTRAELFPGRRLSVHQLHAILRRFTHFACFHGSRVDDPGVFYREGLHISDSTALDARARTICVRPEFPWITEERFAEAVTKLGPRDHGKAYVVIDGLSLLEVGGGYFIYGSERVQCLANTFGLADVLKRSGMPVLVEFHIPAYELVAGTLESLAASISRLENRRNRIHRPYFDYSLIFERPLPAEWVKSHRVVDKIRDPLNGSIYRTAVAEIEPFLFHSSVSKSTV